LGLVLVAAVRTAVKCKQFTYRLQLEEVLTSLGHILGHDGIKDLITCFIL